MAPLLISCTALLAVVATFRWGSFTRARDEGVEKAKYYYAFINRPFILSVIIIINYIVKDLFGIIWEPYIFFIYGILTPLVILFTLLRIYNLFNFDDKDYGFGKTFWKQLYKWFFKPRFI